jgi:hypothetical protein
VVAQALSEQSRNPDRRHNPFVDSLNESLKDFMWDVVLLRYDSCRRRCHHIGGGLFVVCECGEAAHEAELLAAAFLSVKLTTKPWAYRNMRLKGCGVIVITGLRAWRGFVVGKEEHMSSTKVAPQTAIWHMTMHLKMGGLWEIQMKCTPYLSIPWP